jgi:hypothetical protein
MNIVDEVLLETEEFGSLQPSAAKNLSSLREDSMQQQQEQQQQQYRPPSRGPRTRAVPIASSSTEVATTTPATVASSSSSIASSSGPSFSCLPARYIKLEFENTWGDGDYLGLNGVEILGADAKPLSINPKSILTDAESDLLSFNVNERTVENLVNGLNNTANKQFMWLVTNEDSKSSSSSSSRKKKHFVEFDMKKMESLAGLR